MAEYDSNPRPHAAFAAAEDPQLQKVKNKYTNWVNDRLKDTNLRVKDLQVDLADGVTLLKLLQCLVPSEKFPRLAKNPRTLVVDTAHVSLSICRCTDNTSSSVVMPSCRLRARHSLYCMCVCVCVCVCVCNGSGMTRTRKMKIRKW